MKGKNYLSVYLAPRNAEMFETMLTVLLKLDLVVGSDFS